MHRTRCRYLSGTYSWFSCRARFGQSHIGVGCMSMNAILPRMVSFKALYSRETRAYMLTRVQWKSFE